MTYEAAEGKPFKNSVVKSLSELLIVRDDSFYNVSVSRAPADVDATSKLSYAIPADSCSKAHALTSHLSEVYQDGRFTRTVRRNSGISTLKVTEMIITYQDVIFSATPGPSQSVIDYVIQLPGTFNAFYLMFLTLFISMIDMPHHTDNPSN